MENTPLDQQELESMRTQMDLLRQKLDQETIINEKLMRETLKTPISSINKIGWLNIACVIFCIIIYPLLPKLGLNISNSFIIATIVIVVVDGVITFLAHNQVKERKLMGEDMKTVAYKMKIFKKRYQWMTWIEVPLVFGWAIWFIYEFSKGFGIPWLYGAIVSSFGVILGILFAWLMYHKVMKSCDAIIKQIEE